MLIIRINDPKSTNGDDIRNENVIPNGNPTLVNPMNMGMDEHEQNGVTVPSNAATIFPLIPDILSSIFWYVPVENSFEYRI